MAARKKQPDFETAIEQLESLVNTMESGELTLEESLQAFEQGIKLTRDCQAKLANAEQKVQMLLQDGDQLVAQALEDSGEE